MKLCTDCKYCIEMDYGYSNYTVEGTEVDCLLHKNEDFPKDRFYGEEPALNFANNCVFYEEGGSVEIDVDQDEGAFENYSSDEKIKLLLNNYENC